MIRSIKQRIYVTGVLPLAVLAVALVAINGAVRVRDAERELQNARNVTAELLQGPAVDALVIGNTLGFQSIAEKAIETSQSLVCISLRDMSRQVLARAGSCERFSSSDAVPVRSRSSDLSDFEESNANEAVIGELRITINDDAVVRRRNAVLVQLAISFLLIGAVTGVVGRVLRTRLIAPIERIDGAMYALSQQNYSATLEVVGDDELARLANAVNVTTATIARYTRELEQRRQDADQALQDADEATLAKDALIRTLAVDLEVPLAAMHSRLTQIAMANDDLRLKKPIREVIAAIQEAQANLTDLLEIAATAQRKRRANRVTISDVIAEIEGEVRKLSEDEHLPIHLTVTRHQAESDGAPSVADMLVAFDVSRWRKALRYLIRAMCRRCEGAGVFMTAEFIVVAPDEVLVTLQFKSLYAKRGADAPSTGEADTDSATSPAAILGWTERERRVLEYLLRELNVAPTFSIAAPGILNVLLQIRMEYMLVGAQSHEPDRGPAQTRTLIVSDDPSLIRIASRSDVANDEVRAVPFAQALSGLGLRLTAEALVIDLTGDISDAFSLLDALKANEERPELLIAVCPPGNLSDSLSERMFELGFAAVLQKPVQYGRLRQVIRGAVAGSSSRFIAK